VVINPGRTEAIEKYFEVAERLTAEGFVVLVHDWRGQGLSHRALRDRRLGHARGYGEFLGDHAAVLDVFSGRLPSPWLVVGHSMGGCLSLLALAKGERRFAAAVLSAPMLGIRTGSVPRPLARGLAGLLSGVGLGGAATPGPTSAPSRFETNIVTHDRARFERNEAVIAACPDLALGLPTWGWLDFAFRATSELQTGAGVTALRAPITVVAAGDDVLVDNAALKAVTARLPRGRYVEIPGAYHEILQETDPIQAVFWREFDAVADAVAPRR
jgi:lysophospholipase